MVREPCYVWLVMEEDPETNTLLDCVSVCQDERDATFECYLRNKHTEDPRDYRFFVQEMEID